MEKNMVASSQYTSLGVTGGQNVVLLNHDVIFLLFEFLVYS